MKGRVNCVTGSWLPDVIIGEKSSVAFRLNSQCACAISQEVKLHFARHIQGTRTLNQTTCKSFHGIPAQCLNRSKQISSKVFENLLAATAPNGWAVALKNRPQALWHNDQRRIYLQSPVILAIPAIIEDCLPGLDKDLCVCSNCNEGAANRIKTPGQMHAATNGGNFCMPRLSPKNASCRFIANHDPVVASKNTKTSLSLKVHQQRLWSTWLH